MEYLSPTGSQHNALSRMQDNRIGQLAREADSVGKKDDAELKSLAKKFESIFVNLLLKEMRQTVPKSELMRSFSGDMYQSLFDEEVAAKVSEARGIGLADALYNQFSRLRGDSESGPAEEGKRQAGTEATSFTLAQPKEVER